MRLSRRRIGFKEIKGVMGAWLNHSTFNPHKRPQNYHDQQRGRGSSKPAWRLSEESFYQRFSRLNAWSVYRVGKHAQKTRRPLAAFFNIPTTKIPPLRRWSIGLFWVLTTISLPINGEGQELGSQTIERRAHQTREDSIRAFPQGQIARKETDGIVLLRRPKLFSIESHSSYQLTDNAFLSEKQKRHDHILNQTLLLRAGTRIAQRVDVFMSASTFLTRYHRNQSLDFNGVTGSAGIRMPLGEMVMGLQYDGSAIYDRNFHLHLVTLHHLSWDLSTTITLHPATVAYPFLSVMRIWSTPDDFSYTALVAGGTLTHFLGQNFIMLMQGQADYRSYDDFFEPSIREMRNDYGVRLSGGLTWIPRGWVDLTISATLARNESTVSTLRYTNMIFSPSIRLSVRF